MYKNRIEKDLKNCQRIFSTLNKDEVILNNNNVNDINNKKDLRTIDRKIYEILNSKDYIYKADVVIVFKDKTVSKRIIGRFKNKLITMDNEYIDIADIIDIYKEKRN